MTDPTVTKPTGTGQAGRVLIAGTHSGCGKTTVTVALIAALRARGLPVASFKCGPDYIDPSFHRQALGVPAHNLDPFFCSPPQLAQMVAEHGAGRISVVEGVMGYYDGIGTTPRASTFEVAQATATPAVLVVDASAMAASLGAVVEGFGHFREPSGIAGVIVGQVPASMAGFYDRIVGDAGLTALGCLPQDDRVRLPSRHLGLVTAPEIDSIGGIVARLGRLAEDNVDLDGLIELAGSAGRLPSPEPGTPSAPGDDSSPVRIAVARDEAFCFVYAETLELWQRLGGKPVFFSPLSDTRLPEDVDALYLPGGYPENHLEALSGNAALRREIRAKVEAGLPTIAECGGFMYLHASIDGQPMAGVIDAAAVATPRLQRFGYTTLGCRHDCLLGRAGDDLPAHEFHYYDSADPGDDLTARKASSGARYPGGHATATLYAGFPHLYLAAAPAAARRFVAAARAHSSSAR